MNLFSWLKKLLSPTFEKAKAQVLKEIDKVIADLQKPDSATVSGLVGALKNNLSRILGGAHLPGAAAVLLQIALSNVDWVGLAQKPAADVVAELRRLREKVAGARL